MKYVLIQGNVLNVLKKMPDDFVDTIITSPPYWGLRDYGEETNTIWGGNSDCEHEWDKNFLCKKCGAWYGQLGLEPTLDLYLEHMLQITAELKRVLKKTGVMFWNHGDCYGGSLQGYGASAPSKTGFQKPCTMDERYTSNKPPMAKYRAKCMMMQNYRLVFKMIDEQGWILRNTIIWYKPNGMPSSVKDRFSNSYEPVFMLVKNKRYWFDLDAVRVPNSEISKKRAEYETRRIKSNRGVSSIGYKSDKYGMPARFVKINSLGKNPGDLWTIPTQPFPGSHFATFPEKLVKPMIKSSCPKWICKKCGKARERITKRGRLVPMRADAHKLKNTQYPDTGKEMGGAFSSGRMHPGYAYERYTLGWTDCGCNAGWESGIVLDPFIGSGTTMKVARMLRRSCIGIDINPKYINMAKKRVKWKEGLGVEFLEYNEEDLDENVFEGW